MSKCAAITRAGKPCKGLVQAGNDYCPAHDPARSEARRRAASKAGRAKPGTELHDVKETLRQLADDVLEGKVGRANASVAAQVLGVYLRAVDAEMKLKEQQELEERLEELETVLNREKGARGWR